MVIFTMAVSADDQPNIKAYLLKLDEQVNIIAEQAEVIGEFKNSSIAGLEKDLEEYKNTTTALNKDIEKYKNTTIELENKLEDQAKVIEEYKNTTADLENEVETMEKLIANLTAARGEGKKGR